MFPYRFDPPGGDDQAAYGPDLTPATPQPAPARASIPAADAPVSTSVRGRGRRRRLAQASLLALTLAGGTVGGGAIGALAAARWVAPQQVTTAVVSPQPANLQSPPQASVAGTVYSAVSGAVVEINVAGQSQFGQMPSGSGSGFVVDARGLILTNNHVVEGGGTVSVTFSDGTTREAQVLGTDRGNDLAVLRVDLPANIPVATLGDSDQVQVGETAIAIGSPFGLEQTVTQGIISAVDRTWFPANGRAQRDLLQTDTPINPGNSGGPLLNARGEVIGVNSMIESPVRGSVGVGFAIPINTAKQLIPQLEAGAQLQPVWLGIRGTEIDPVLAADQGLSVQAGVLVTDVVTGGSAAAAGLRGGTGVPSSTTGGGDIITAVDGVAIADMAALSEQLAGHQPGDTVSLTIIRDGQEQQVQVTLQAWPIE